MKTIILIIAVLLAGGVTALQGQGTITFNAAANFSGTNYIELGMKFCVVVPPPEVTSDRMYISPAVTSSAGHPYNNTPYILFVQSSSSNDYVFLNLTNGNTFGLKFVSLADPWAPSTTSLPITFKGAKADGSQVSITFATPGNNADYLQTYPFDSDFASGLTNIEIYARRWSMDNLVVTTGAATSPPSTISVAPLQFGAATSFPAGSSPVSLVVADCNGDGKPDILTAYYNAIVLLRGIGNGLLASPTNYTVNNTVTLALGDFNRDGKLDVVAPGRYGGAMFLGSGTGSFVKTNLTLDIGDRIATTVADFNGDQKLDFATTLGGNIDIEFGRGDGSVSASENYIIGTALSDIIAGDVNGDGTPDLIFSQTYSTNSFGVLINNGDGTFATARYYLNTGSNDYHYSLTLGDFTGDGSMDAAVLNYNAQSVTIWLNNGQWYWTAKDYTLGLKPTSIATGDFNGDGKLDFIIRGGSTARLLLGNGDGSFTVGSQMSVPSDSSKSPVTVAVGDFNSDGLLDIALTSDNNNSVAIMLNQTPPALKITPLAGYNQVSWPSAFETYALESTTNLSAPGSWQPFPYPPVVSGSQKAITDWAVGEQKFYRLKKP